MPWRDLSVQIDVRYPAPRTRNGIEYAWRELARRAGLHGRRTWGESPGTPALPVAYARPDAVELERPGLIIVPARRGAFRRATSAAADSLRWVRAADLTPSDSQLSVRGRIPVLFWGTTGEAGGRAFAERTADGHVVFHADVLAATLFMLTRWEESVVDERDRHDRFPAAASFAHRQGFLDRPVVDEYALALREWLRVLSPRWRPRPRRFSVRLSHDIDHLRRYPDVRIGARAVARHLIRERRVRRAGAVAADLLAEVVTPRHGPFVRGIRTLSELARRHGFDEVAFYFMTAGRHSMTEPYAPEYDLTSRRARRIVEFVRAQGHEIGFHPGYSSVDDFEVFAREKALLDEVVGGGRYGGRQHYLRFRVPETWRFWERAGLSYDSTMGYADHEGFRCGTCHPFRPFDFERDREVDVVEWPLIVQDATLRGYRDMPADAAVERARELARRCRAVEGTFTLLWHNSSFHYEWRAWANVYDRILSGLRSEVSH